MKYSVDYVNYCSVFDLYRGTINALQGNHPCSTGNYPCLTFQTLVTSCVLMHHYPTEPFPTLDHLLLQD